MPNIGKRDRLVLYIDLFFLLNFAADFFLVCITGKSSGFSSSPKRVILACFISSVCACISEILSSRAAELGFLFLLPPILIFICFGRMSTAKYIEALIVFWGSSFLLGGITTVILSRLGHILSPSIFFAAVLFVMFFCFLYFDIFSTSKDIRSVEIFISSKKRTEKLLLLCDSGNLLKEPIGGLPVILISKQIFDRLFPEARHPESISCANIGMRILPIRTAAGNTLSVAAKADSARIQWGDKESDITSRVLIGRAEQNSFSGFDGIFPVSLL